MPLWLQLPRKLNKIKCYVISISQKQQVVTTIFFVSTVNLTNIRIDVLLLLLAVLQFLLQLDKLNADHLQVALVIALQLVHNKSHVADLREAIDKLYVKTR